jgi:hypothetical protein
MRQRDREPSLEDMLSDPIVKIVMAADGVDAQRLEITLREIAIALRAAQPAYSCQPRD